MAWKRKLGWIAVVLVTSIAVIGGAGYLVLRSPRFHEYLLAQIEQQASEATRAEVRVQKFALHFSRLTADAYGITVRGNPPASACPLVQADQLRIRLRIVSVLRKKVDLRGILLRHPVVNRQRRKDGTRNIRPLPNTNTIT